MRGNPFAKIIDEERVREILDLKERIAAIIFDFDGDDDYVRPHEETCRKLAVEILKVLP